MKKGRPGAEKKIGKLQRRGNQIKIKGRAEKKAISEGKKRTCGR